MCQGYEFTSNTVGTGNLTITEDVTGKLETGDLFRAQIYNTVVMNANTINEFEQEEWEIANNCVYVGGNQFSPGNVEA